MTVWLEVNGKKQKVELGGGAVEGAAECRVDGREVAVDVRMLQPGVLSLVMEGLQYRCVQDGAGVVIGGRRFAFEVNDPRSLQASRGGAAGAQGPKSIKAPMPGRVVRVLVGVGTEVEEGQAVVVIEAMKMQNELKSPKAGRVVRLGAAAGDTVAAGDVLVVVE